VFQWLRAAKDDAARRRICLIYAATISIAQVGWVVQIVVPSLKRRQLSSPHLSSCFYFSGF
jgi:hypothetical protein